MTMAVEAGGASPVSASRTISRTASTTALSSPESGAPIVEVEYFLFSLADRFCATPAIWFAPIASTRAVSAASKIAFAAGADGQRD